MKLTVLIPVYNEIKTIKEILLRVKAVRLDKEIIIVDDGSKDGTREFLLSCHSERSEESLAYARNSNKLRDPSSSKTRLRMTYKQGNKIKTFFHKKNLGKGAAIRTGLKHAKGNVLVVQDADLEYDPNDYLKLIKPIQKKEAQVVYGTRLKTLTLSFFGAQKTPLPLHYLANAFLSKLTNVIYKSELTDMETGYKMMTRKVYKKLKIHEDGFAVEPEITAKILKMGYKIYEVPIKTQPRNYREGKKITFGDAVIAVWTLLKYRF